MQVCHITITTSTGWHYTCALWPDDDDDNDEDEDPLGADNPIGSTRHFV